MTDRIAAKNPFDMPKAVTVHLETTHSVDFGFHIENDEIIIDSCEGISVADGLSLFEPWMLGLEPKNDAK